MYEINIGTSEQLAKVHKRTGLNDEHARVAQQMFFAARETFNAFATMDAPMVPSNTIDALQVKLVRWQTNNFGIPKPCEIACGITEEMGERSLAIMELNTAEIADAVGDVQVYACQLATARRLGFRTIDNAACDSGELAEVFFHRLRPVDPARLLTVATGYLCHVQLKAEQRIREGAAGEELTRYATFLGLVMLQCALYKTTGASVLNIFAHVSEQVLARDWTKNRTTGSSR